MKNKNLIGGKKMLNFNVKQLFLTKASRLDLTMYKNRIYLIIYNPVDKKVLEDGREVPLFRKFADNKVIEDKSAVKLSEYELGIFITLLTKFISFNYNTEKLYKLIQAKYSNLIKKQAKFNEQEGILTISFYRPEKKFFIQFLSSGIRFNLMENNKKYSITVPNESIEYLKLAFDFALTEYLKNFRFEITQEEVVSKPVEQEAPAKVVKREKAGEEESINENVVDIDIDEEDDNFEF
jgi:hypothetical protein